MVSLSNLRLLGGAALVFFSLLPTVHATGMSAWTTDKGPQLMVQNLTTGRIMYSLCNSTGTPIWPTDLSNIMPLTYPPKIGTSLSGVGWFDGNSKTTTASIFYQDKSNNFVNSLLICTWKSGMFSHNGSWIVSGGAPSIHNNTGLSAILLGADTGYRLYYHDTNMSINEIGYTRDSDWHYRGFVSHDKLNSTVIHAAFSGTGNISVVNTKDAENIETARYNSDLSWHISTFPRPLAGSLTNITTDSTNPGPFVLNSTYSSNFTLPSVGSAQGIGLSIDATANRTLWYIGSDRALHAATNANPGGVWGPVDSQPATVWPLADDPSAPLAVTSDADDNTVNIYYFVNSTLTEIKRDGSGTWHAAAALPAFNATAPGPDDDPAPSSAPDDSGGGLSTGARAGIGVGAALAALAIAGTVGAILFFRRRDARRRREAQQRVDAQPRFYNGHAYYGGDAPPPLSSGEHTLAGQPEQKVLVVEKMGEEERHQVDSVNMPHEMMGRGLERYELPDQLYTHELGAEHREGKSLADGREG